MNLSAPLTDLGNALECLAGCQLVYQTATITSSDCNILIAELDNCIHLDFRGSLSPQDWLSDAEVNMIRVNGGRAHAGIWMSYQAVSSQLRTKLKSMSRKPIVGAGHSRGGGHAEACAYDLFGEYEIALVSTFGGMKWADAQLAAQYDKWLKPKTVRWVNALDPVPGLPLDLPTMTYTAVGNEAYLPSAGGLAMDPGFWELAEDDLEDAAINLRSGNVDVLHFHLLNNYQARIQSLVSPRDLAP